jgi:hypothetical protein
LLAHWLWLAFLLLLASLSLAGFSAVAGILAVFSFSAFALCWRPLLMKVSEASLLPVKMLSVLNQYTIKKETILKMGDFRSVAPKVMKFRGISQISE